MDPLCIWIWMKVSVMRAPQKKHKRLLGLICIRTPGSISQFCFIDSLLLLLQNVGHVRTNPNYTMKLGQTTTNDSKIRVSEEAQTRKTAERDISEYISRRLTQSNKCLDVVSHHPSAFNLRI